MIRRSWADLPVRVRAEVERHCGAVLGESVAPAGRNSEFAMTLRVAGGQSVAAGSLFIKGITSGRAEVRAHRHEAYVNSRLPDLAPRLLWTVEVDGWLLLGFEHIQGRHADLAPGSPDLRLVVEAVGALAEGLGHVAGAPGLAAQWSRLAAWRRLRHDPPVDLDPWSRANLDRFVDWERGAVDAVTGTSLAHTDLHSLNLLVGGGRLRVVDWAWSRHAQPWVDTGFLILRLIESGHSPAEAEQWAKEIGVWAEAPEDDRTAFAVAVLGIWEFLQRDSPLPHRAGLTVAARRWVRHRPGTG